MFVWRIALSCGEGKGGVFYLVRPYGLETVEVTFPAVTVATAVLKGVHGRRGTVLLIAAGGLDACHHPLASRMVVARCGLLVAYADMSAHRQGDGLEHVGASRKVAAHLQAVLVVTVYQVGQTVAVDVVHGREHRAHA